MGQAELDESRCAHLHKAVERHKWMEMGGQAWGRLEVTSSTLELNRNASGACVLVTLPDEKVVSFHTVTEQTEP